MALKEVGQNLNQALQLNFKVGTGPAVTRTPSYGELLRTLKHETGFKPGQIAGPGISYAY